MDKSPEAFRTISEVADALDVPPHVLRFWETRFAQVKPVKRGGGRRYYRPEDVRLLRGIRGLLYDDGMTIKGVQKILRERGIRHVIGLGTAAERRASSPRGRARRPVRKPRPSRPARRAAARPSSPGGGRRRRAAERRSPRRRAAGATCFEPAGRDAGATGRRHRPTTRRRWSTAARRRAEATRQGALRDARSPSSRRCAAVMTGDGRSAEPPGRSRAGRFPLALGRARR